MTKNVPTTTTSTPTDLTLPEFLSPGELEEFAGIGNSQAAEDNTLPFLAILQKGSPQVNKRDAAYVEGAEPGFLFNTATKEIYDTSTNPLPIIPCGYHKAYVEWIPRTTGGGYVATHEFSPNTLTALQVQRDEKNRLTLPNGNTLAETAYTFILLDGQPAVIGATSTALKPMRDWMSLRNKFKTPNGRPIPSFARQYLAKTVYLSNDAGDWFNWSISDGGFITDSATYNAAKEFALSIAQGKINIGRPPEDNSQPQTDNTPF